MQDLELVKEMHYSLLIALIYLAAAISTSNVADGLNDAQNEAHVLRHQELTQVYVNFLRSLDAPFCPFTGMTRLKGFIFLLCDRRPIDSIRVYEDSTPFDLLMIIPSEEMFNPWHFASSAASQCLYFVKYNSLCIWKIALEDHQVTKWLCVRERPYGLTVSNDGQVVAVQYDKTSKRQFIEIYGPDAAFFRRIDLTDTRDPIAAILKPDGQFITFFHLQDVWYHAIVISLVTANGQVISQVDVKYGGHFPPSNIACWSFQSNITQVIDFFFRCIREGNKDYHYYSAHLILEETIIPLLVSWDRTVSGRQNMILIDAQVEFGVNSSEINLIIHKC